MSKAKQVTEENTELKFLTNAELREEICYMAEVTPKKPFDRPNKSSARKLRSLERTGIIMHVISDMDFALGEFGQQAIEEKIQRSNTKTQNKLIGRVCDLGDSDMKNSSRLQRTELKALYRFLEEFNNDE